MEDKREDLIAEKRKNLLLALVEEISRDGQDLYYRPTIEIAHTLQARIKAGKGLTLADRELLEGLSVGDIQVLLSLH